MKKLTNNSDKVFEWVLLLAISAVCIIWSVEEILEVIFDYDRYGYMVTLVATAICFCISYFFQKTHIARVLIFIYLTLYLLWLTIVTFLEAITSGEMYTLASTLLWLPAIYIVSFLFLSTRKAVLGAVAVYCVMLTLLALAHSDVFGLTDAALKALLLHVSLSHGVCIFCLLGVIKLKQISMASDQYAEKMKKAANVDGLLGIGNRRMLQSELNSMASTNQSFSLLLIDVDHFKAINDTHGHLTGDDVLRELTLCIKDNMRPEDTIGRWGGEEFLLLANGAGLDSATQLAERVRAAIEAYEFSQVGKVTISVGVAQFQKNVSVSQTFSIADKALYEAKRLGRNQVVKAA